MVKPEPKDPTILPVHTVSCAVSDPPPVSSARRMIAEPPPLRAALIRPRHHRAAADVEQRPDLAFAGQEDLVGERGGRQSTVGLLEAAHPRNAVRLILPRDGEAGRDRYQVAADCLGEWRR